MCLSETLYKFPVGKTFVSNVFCSERSKTRRCLAAVAFQLYLRVRFDSICLVNAAFDLKLLAQGTFVECIYKEINRIPIKTK